MLRKSWAFVVGVVVHDRSLALLLHGRSDDIQRSNYQGDKRSRSCSDMIYGIIVSYVCMDTYMFNINIITVIDVDVNWLSDVYISYPQRGDSIQYAAPQRGQRPPPAQPAAPGGSLLPLVTGVSLVWALCYGLLPGTYYFTLLGGHQVDLGHLG